MIDVPAEWQDRTAMYKQAVISLYILIKTPEIFLKARQEENKKEKRLGGGRILT